MEKKADLCPQTHVQDTCLDTKIEKKNFSFSKAKGPTEETEEEPATWKKKKAAFNQPGVISKIRLHGNG